MLNDRITPQDLAIGMIFLSLTMVGILGNCSLLYHYLFLSCTGRRLRSTDLILTHLTIANSLVLLTKAVPQTMVAFGWKDFFNDVKCHLFFYVQRVGRGVSIGTICLLSVFQAITISPVNSMWKDLKVKATKYVGVFISFCWTFYLVVNAFFPMYGIFGSGKQGSKNITKKRDLGYCSVVDDEKISGSVYAALIAFPEVSSSVAIIWASASMIFILYRHKQRVQHIRRSNVSPRVCPESRAAKSILVLASTFLSFHTLSSLCQVAIALLHGLSWWLVKINDLVSVCFPTVSPFLVVSHDLTESRLCFIWVRKKKISKS
nr:vomeronasal type-1 receptor 4-like [Microcebus murinus]XP_012613253.2 vomeronasal type-1 receptor 4-like [Microcebus murinus]XP_012613254.2 vomeronasal type-1 receptor 4-like [Microcebus murinus]